jgi:membrane protein DedA with SNARE-associated domain
MIAAIVWALGTVLTGAFLEVAPKELSWPYRWTALVLWPVIVFIAIILLLMLIAPGKAKNIARAVLRRVRHL